MTICPRILLGLELQEIYGIGARMEQRLHRASIYTVAELCQTSPMRLRRVCGGINGVLFHQMLHGADIQPPSSRYSKRLGHEHLLEPDLRTNTGATVSRSTCSPKRPSACVAAITIADGSACTCHGPVMAAVPSGSAWGAGELGVVTWTKKNTTPP
jgi:hypothetical protein